MRKHLVATIALALLVGLLPVLLQTESASGQDAPPTRFTQSGFADDFLFSVDAPTALAFTPDGRMLVASQQGQLRVYDDGRVLSTPALNISSKICSNSERGLLGVAVDPKFATNKFIYVYYTFNRTGQCPTGQPTSPNNPVNQVSRFVLGDNNVATGERILVNNIPSPVGNHNAGDLHFGKDDRLYVSVGDGARGYLARNKSILSGKILRITRDGGIPPTNPYQGAGTARCNLNGQTKAGLKCQEIFASGLRNPFRFAFDPNAAGTRFFINDVGQTTWEEIDQGKVAADYGWDDREGPCAKGSTTDCGFKLSLTNPIYYYNHDRTGCSSITGAAFVPNGAWPASFDGAYLFGDFVCGRIFTLKPKSGGGYIGGTLAYNMGQGGPAAMAFGPDGALYYTTYTNGGEVHLITAP